MEARESICPIPPLAAKLREVQQLRAFKKVLGLHGLSLPSWLSHSLGDSFVDQLLDRRINVTKLEALHEG